MLALVKILLRRLGIRYVLEYPPPETTEYYGDISLAVTTSPLPGQTVGRHFRVSGAGRAFEGTIIWWLYARDNTLLEHGNAQGGSSDGVAPFNFNVTFDPNKTQHLNPMTLVVETDDPSGGESTWVIPQTRTPLIYKP